jgi:hypothetical protein
MRYGGWPGQSHGGGNLAAAAAMMMSAVKGRSHRRRLDDRRQWEMSTPAQMTAGGKIEEICKKISFFTPAIKLLYV